MAFIKFEDVQKHGTVYVNADHIIAAEKLETDPEKKTVVIVVPHYVGWEGRLTVNRPLAEVAALLGMK